MSSSTALKAYWAELRKHPHKLARRGKRKAIEDPRERFLRFVEKTGSGCWLWSGARLKPPVMPYGMFRMSGKSHRAHRASYRFFVGEIPEGMDVCHSCDVPYCVAPKHLWLGTRAENIEDRDGKRRQARGTRIANSKLTPEIVRVIRERYAKGDVSQATLAVEYEVRQCTISDLLRGRTWRAA